MDNSEYNVTELKTKLEKGWITSKEILEHCLNKIAVHNPTLNAIISIESFDQLYEKADKIDKSRARGDLLPQLAGIPIAIKDLCDTKDILTTYGSQIYKKNFPKYDDPMVSNLRKTGLLIIGKTNTPEFGTGSQTYNEVFGTTRNPYNTNKTSGGSSGGGAAAIAAGMLPFADGSDMMGSLRNPTAFCNIYGFRPTPGVIPSINTVLEKTPILSTLGAMAKSPADLIILLGAQFGNLNKNPFVTKNSKIKNKSIKIAWLNDFSGSYPLENGITDLCEKTLGKLEKINISVKEFSPSFSSEKIWNSWIDLRSNEFSKNIGHHYDNILEKELLKTEIIWEIERGRSLPETKILSALKYRRLWFQYTQELFQRFDFLALPSAQVFPFDCKSRYPKEINGKVLDTYHRWMEVVVPASLLGLPVISLPCGFNSNGLPTGMQIIGQRNDDEKILSLAKLFHKDLTN